MSINNRKNTEKFKLFDTFEKAIQGNVWSGFFTPEMGQRVQVTFNNLGKGYIEGFYTVDGYVGVFVKPNNPPDWWTKQSRGSGRTHYEVFGTEIMPAG